jgi:hypothetical protein
LFTFKIYQEHQELLGVSGFFGPCESSFKVSRCNKRSLLDDEIMQELQLDRLSDAPSDFESDKNINDEVDVFGPSMSQKARRRARLEVSDSHLNTDDEDLDVDDGYSKNGDLRNLEQFLGNSSPTFTLSHPISTSEVVNRFLVNDFMTFLWSNESYTMLKIQTNIKTPQIL